MPTETFYGCRRVLKKGVLTRLSENENGGNNYFQNRRKF